MTSVGHPLRPLSHVTAQNVVVRASVGHRSSRRPTSQGDVGSPAGFDEVEVARAASRLDIRRLIGGLFILYGLILLVLGLVGSDHMRTRQPGSTSAWRRRSRGFVFGALMMFWALSRPTVPSPEASRGEGSTVRGRRRRDRTRTRATVRARAASAGRRLRSRARTWSAVSRRR